MPNEMDKDVANPQQLDTETGEEEESTVESALAILGDIVKRSKETLEESAKSASDPPESKDNAQDDHEIQEIQNALDFLVDPENQGAPVDPHFAKLRTEYDKIHKLCIQSRKNEKSLMKKCRELTQELGSNASKVLAALKLSQNDRGTIASLKKEVKTAWKMVESANEKDNRSKEAIASLKLEVDGLKSTLQEAGLQVNDPNPNSAAGFGKNRLLELQIEQEEEIRHLKSEKLDLEAIINNMKVDYQIVTNENNDIQEKVQSLIEEKTRMDEELLALKDLLSTKKSEQDREIRAREKLEFAFRQANDTITRKETELTGKTNEAKLLRDQMTRVEGSLREERQKGEKSEKEMGHLNSKLTRIQQEYEDQVQATSKLINDNQKQMHDMKKWDEELTKYKEECKMISRARDSLAKRIKVTDEAKNSAEIERDELRATCAALGHDIENTRKEMEVANKQIDLLSRDRDMAQKNLVKATGATQKQFNIVKLSEQSQRNLEQEIQGFKDEATKMRKLIYSLEKERDNKIIEASKSEESLMKKEEELKMTDLIVFDSKKKISELERKLKEQQVMYESVRTDRNLYSKNLVESQDEIIEMKRKLKIMTHQIQQLKEEIATKENALIKEHFEHSKLEKEKESLSALIAKIQQQYDESTQMIQNQQAEENKLRHIISEADSERMKQKKEYNTVIQERDILGTQLIRRNDELSLLYEKIKIQASTLNKGEIQYLERLEDIRVLKLEIKKLRREKVILQSETQNVEGLRSEIFRLQREVLRERTRVKVLEEELESPMNIHRWRKLAGSDPSTFELITKIQTLQKRLIAKTEEVVEKELILSQKEKMYKDIKDVLQRQPGPEVIDELRIVKDAVKVKIKESKALASELNMYHSQVNEYKYEIERLNREIQDLKKKYFEQRKKHRIDSKIVAIADRMKEKIGPAAFERLLHTPGTAFSYGNTDKKDLSFSADVKSIRPQLPSGPKFSGGGFNMSATPRMTNSNQRPPSESPSIQPIEESTIAQVISQVNGIEVVAPLVQVPTAALSED